MGSRHITGIFGALLCGAVVASCGGAAPSTMEATSGGMADSGGEIVYQGPPLSDDENQTVHDFDEAVSALEATPTTDCQPACEHGSAVCNLAERICAISERHPGMVDVESRCTDGRRRCESARRSLAQCACPAP